MAIVVVAADGKWVRDQVRTAVTTPGTTVVEITRGQDVRGAVAAHSPDVVVLDLQIANMGGIAVAIDLHLEADAGRIPAVPVLLLLDREHDRFIAQRADADAVLVKPVDPGTLRRTVQGLLDGATPRPGVENAPDPRPETDAPEAVGA